MDEFESEHEVIEISDDLEEFSSETDYTSTSEEVAGGNLNGEDLPIDGVEQRPQAEKRVIPSSQLISQQSASEENFTCVICFDGWTSTGNHRVCSLRCGHLFGRSCIERWLREKGVHAKCPQCNTKSKVRDLRNLFVKKLVAIDRTEVDSALRNLEIEKQLKREAEESETRILLKYQQVLSQLEYTKLELRHYKSMYEDMKNNGMIINNSTLKSADDSMIDGVDMEYNTKIKGQFKFVSSMKVSINGGSRVSCYNRPLGIHVVSKPSPNQSLCPGYGVLKINSVEFYSSRTKTEFFRLHSNVIRDVAFSPHSPNQILTGSIDKTIKLSDIEHNTPILTYKTDAPVWSCCWDEYDSNTLYAGLANGSVNVYDIRNTVDVVESMSANSYGFTSTRAPVISIKPIHVSNTNHDSTSSRQRYGICVTALDCLYFIEKTQHQTFPHRFPSIKGSFMSMKVDPSRKCCLYSLRPGIGRDRVAHRYGSIEPLKNSVQINDGDHFDLLSPLQFNVSKEFTGGNSASQMIRSAIVTLPVQNISMVISGDEAARSAIVWDVASGKVFQNLTHDSANILDIESFTIGQYSFLSTLSESTLSIYRWAPDSC